MTTDASRPSADAGAVDAIATDTHAGCLQTLIPGPCQTGYDPALETLATNYERSFHLLSAATMDVWSDIRVDDPADRQLVESFLQQSNGWDLAAHAGKPVTEVVDSWGQTAGLYAGAGIAADAFRYGVLRDQGYPAAEVQRARQYLLAGLDGLHVAVAITGTPGAIARGFIRTDIPANVPATTPLFDASGKPLPAEKDNGTWREDNSGGQFPSYVWLDSCSRDQLIGWIAAFGAAWEVIKDDPTIGQPYKQRLQQEAKLLGDGLKTVRKSGYDLELIDADGRTTYHGYLNEYNFERIYIPNPLIKNGFYANMALGIVATLASVSEDAAITDYLVNKLIAARKLHLVGKNQFAVDMGPKTNHSNYNMAFMGSWLATRYLNHPQALTESRVTLGSKLYDNPAGLINPQPKGWKQSLYDLIYAAGLAGASAHGPTAQAVDASALASALDTLGQFPTPPYWSTTVQNCDAQELSAGVCTAIDGKTQLVLNPNLGHGDVHLSKSPLPLSLRPKSNYHWRSNPFEVNGTGNSGLMYAASDFRFAYWLGRWVRR